LRAALPRAFRTPVLLVEVADSSLEWDRDVKIPMYGRHGVIE